MVTLPPTFIQRQLEFFVGDGRWGGDGGPRSGAVGGAERSGGFDPNVWTRRALQEKTMSLERRVLHQCIRPRVGAPAPDHHGNPRAPDLISGHASKGYLGSSVLGCAGKTISPSLLFLSQTSVGKTIVALTLRFSSS
jgi:hypothetical protein